MKRHRYGMRLLCVLLAAIVLVLSLSGCSENATADESYSGTYSNSTLVDTPEIEFHMPNFENDYFEVFCDHCTVLGHGGFAVTNCTRFAMISAQPLTENDVKVTSSYDGTVSMALTDENYSGDPREWFSEYIFFLFQGYSAEDIFKYEEGRMSGAQREEMNALRSAYRKLTMEDIPTLYLYTLNVLPKEYEYDVKDITVTVRGVSKTYEFEQMVMQEITEAPFQYWPGEVSPLRVETFILDGAGCEVNDDGCFTVFATLEIREDVSLRNIWLYDPADAEVLCAEIIQTDTSGNEMSSLWDMQSDYPLLEGENVLVTVYLRDPRTAGLLWQNRTYYLIFDYTVDGENVYSGSEAIFLWQRQGNPYIYLAALQGYDAFRFVLY